MVMLLLEAASFLILGTQDSVYFFYNTGVLILFVINPFHPASLNRYCFLVSLIKYRSLATCVLTLLLRMLGAQRRSARAS
jgi:hypothetical protein